MKFCLTVFLLLSNLILFSQDTTSMLIIGNSITYWNDLGGLVEDVFQSQESLINVKVVGYPGVSLSDHITSVNDDSFGYTISSPISETEKKSPTVKILESKCWDYLLLQDGLYTRDEDSFLRLSRDVNGCQTKVLYFEGYSTILWSDSLRSIEVSGNKEFMDRLADKSGGVVLPVGDAFHQINVYSKDRAFWVYRFDAHPKELGSLVMALLIYNKVTGKAIEMERLGAAFPEYQVELGQICNLLGLIK